MQYTKFFLKNMIVIFFKYLERLSDDYMYREKLIRILIFKIYLKIIKISFLDNYILYITFCNYMF